MKVAGIVAEYNPFHNGHKFQVDSLVERGFSHIVCALSGNFVQRGDVAIIDKWQRTKMALENGVDLVLEIPTSYCLAPAEKYAFSAVEILDNTGVVDSLCFGSETGELDTLLALCKDILKSDEVNQKIKQNLKSGVTFSAARSSAIKDVFGEKYADILKNPNDILGLEYINALNSLDSKIKPFAIKRTGAMHNDTKTSDNIASASSIRNFVFENEAYENFLPEKTNKILETAKAEKTFPVRLENANRVIISKLREKEKSDFEKLNDVCEGLHNRLYDAVRQAETIDEVYNNAKTKRYTMAKIRRLYLNALLDIYSYEKPPYLRVLGFSEKGKELLSEIKKRCSLPIVSSYSDAKRISKAAQEYFEKEAKFTDFYSMLTPKIQPTGAEFSQGIVKIN